MILKQVKTKEHFTIYINHWIQKHIEPIATFVDKDYKDYHLVRSEDDSYALIELVVIDQFFVAKPTNIIPFAVVRVLQDLPIKSSDAKPIEFIDTITDIYDKENDS